MGRGNKTKPKWKITAKGRQYLYANLAILLAAYFVNYSILYLLASFFLILVIYNYIYLKLTLKDIELTLRVPDELFVGQTQQWVLTLKNLKRWTPFPSAFIWLGETHKKGEQFEFPWTAARGRNEDSRRISLGQRGWFEIEQVRIQSGFPFGFIEREILMPFSFRLLVYPQPLEMERALHNRQALISGMLPQNTGDFQYLKPYELGDDVRLIHWRKSTLAEAPVVRRDLVKRDEIRPHVLIPDACTKFEEVVRLLTTWVLEGEIGSAWQGWSEQGPHPFVNQVEALTWLATVQPLVNREILEIDGDQLLRFSEIQEWH